MDYLHRRFLLWLAILFSVGFVARSFSATLTATGTIVEWSNVTGEWKDTTFTYTAIYEVLQISCENRIYQFELKSLHSEPGPSNHAKGYLLGGTIVGGTAGAVGERRHFQVPAGGNLTVTYGVVRYDNVSTTGGVYSITLVASGRTEQLIATPTEHALKPDEVATGQVTLSNLAFFPNIPASITVHVIEGDAEASIDDNGNYAITAKTSDSIVEFRRTGDSCVSYAPAQVAIFVIETYCVAWKINLSTEGVAAVLNPQNYYTFEIRRGGQVIESKQVMWGDVQVIRASGMEDKDPPCELYSETYDPTWKWNESLGVWQKVGLEISLMKKVDTQTPSTAACAEGFFAELPKLQLENPPKITNPIDPQNPGKVNPPPNEPPKEPTVGKDADGKEKKAGGTIWNTTVIEGGQLREELFVEGVGKLEKQLEGINAKLEGSGGGGANGQAVADAAAAGAAAAAEAETEGAEAAQEAGASVPTVGQPGQVAISKAEPNWIITFPAVMGGKSVDLNPFRSDRFGPLIDWFRAATAWAVIILFGFWASHQVKDWVKGASQIRQAQGNAVIGGTGAQATALIAAGAITVAVSTFMVALIGWLGGDFALPAILSKISENPTMGIPSGAAWILDRVFPVATIIAALVAKVAWNFYASSIFAVAMTVIRFIVP